MSTVVQNFPVTAEDRAFDAFMASFEGKWWPGKIVGVTHPNLDGSSRQQLVRVLGCEDELELRPEPENEYDPNAIAVYADPRHQIGYLESRTAVEVARNLKKGIRYRCFVKAVRETKGIAGVAIGLVQLP